jgi:hypothetical protein
MNDLPPPPSEPYQPSGQPYSAIPVPRAGPPRRPGVVTGAAVILIVAGVLAIIAGFVVLNGSGALEVPGADAEDVSTIVAVVAFGLGALDIVAGLLIMRLSSGGRVLGIVIAVLGILSGLGQLSSSGSSGLLSIALYAFVLYALLAYGFVFRQAAEAR